MYTREKPCREEFHKSRKNHNIPSFSSTLLDEIYRSIDGSVSKSESDFETYREKKPSKRHGEIASFRRACLVEKWIEKEAIATRKPTLLQDFENDLMFFSSTSSSSDSSGALSSSDTEFFGSSSSSATTKPKASCFSARLKPVRTGAEKNDEKNKMEDDMMKSKSRALKIYANLKKVKQPISPGGRLTSFINSLFSNANGKKTKNQDLKPPSSCSSASSFSRSCLSKNPPNSRNGDQRTVRFHPVSVIVDEDSRPCGQKCTYDEKLPLRPPTEIKKQSSGKVVEVLKGYNGKRADEFSAFRKIHGRGDEEEEEEDEDCMSDSSSDLFELDHLSLFGDNRFCQELPVYETTHFDTNRAIANGLIR